ncbi:MAG: hypothetical protein ABL308_08765 [Oceanicaulis sp.]
MIRLIVLALVLVLAGCAGTGVYGPGLYDAGRYSLALQSRWSRIGAAADGDLATAQLTRDGLFLNRVILVSELRPGGTLFTPGFDHPPRFDPAAGEAGIDTFLTGSIERLDYQGLEITKRETDEDWTVRRLAARRPDALAISGLAWSRVQDGRLDLVIYLAPDEHYFERDRAEVEQMLRR